MTKTDQRRVWKEGFTEGKKLIRGVSTGRSHREKKGTRSQVWGKGWGESSLRDRERDPSEHIGESGKKRKQTCKNTRGSCCYEGRRNGIVEGVPAGDDIGLKGPSNPRVLPEKRKRKC